MKRIGLLSDTHGDIPAELGIFFADCDEIWHAGDIGNRSVVDRLLKIKPLRAVYGNIDGADIRQEFPEYLAFMVEEVKVLMIHIGGYQGRYESKALNLIRQEKPRLLIAGHSHILKVIYDQKYGLLFINPGAAGNSGWHKVITYARFTIEGDQIKDLEIGELPRKGGQR